MGKMPKETKRVLYGFGAALLTGALAGAAHLLGIDLSSLDESAASSAAPVAAAPVVVIAPVIAPVIVLSPVVQPEPVTPGPFFHYGVAPPKRDRCRHH